MQNSRKRDDGLVKKSDWNEGDGLCRQEVQTIENVSLQTSHVEKGADEQDNFKEAEGANPANCGL